MQKLISLWNKNRWKIIITVLIIIFVIILIYTINSILSRTQEKNYTNTNQIEDISIPSESVISGGSVSEQVTEENIEVIKKFVDYCNNGEYQNAYNLLTDDCKSELFQNKQIFINNYCNTVFSTDKIYSLELWYYSGDTYTYRITYRENNLLETGILNSDSNVEDYITVVKLDTGDKLNISNFIQKAEINKESEVEGIKINIKERIRYRTYERYLVQIENNTSNVILLSEGTNDNDICLVDTNEYEYDCMLNEISLSDLEMQPYSKKTIYISFNKLYNSYRIVESIRFKNIIANKEEYQVDRVNARRIGIDIVI